jgi:hypothetical protein
MTGSTLGRDHVHLLARGGHAAGFPVLHRDQGPRANEQHDLAERDGLHPFDAPGGLEHREQDVAVDAHLGPQAPDGLLPGLPGWSIARQTYRQRPANLTQVSSTQVRVTSKAVVSWAVESPPTQMSKAEVSRTQFRLVVLQ